MAARIYQMMGTWSAALFCVVIPVLSLGQDPWKNVYRESAWKERDGWQRSEEILRLMRVRTGSVVADIGCNEGYMTVKLAAATSPGGRVYAVDVNQSKLDLLSNHLRERKISNVVMVKGDNNNPRLPEGQLDAVLILDTYHEMVDHDLILGHIHRALKPGHRLVLCEPIADERRTLPRKTQEQRHELGMEFAIADLKKAGFDIEWQEDPFVDRKRIKGDVMWIVVARKR